MTKWKVEYLRTEKLETKIVELLYSFKYDNVTIQNTHYCYKTNKVTFIITIPEDYQITIFNVIRGNGFSYTEIP